MKQIHIQKICTHDNSKLSWFYFLTEISLEQPLKNTKSPIATPQKVLHYSDWVCTAVMSNDVMKDLRG